MSIADKMAIFAKVAEQWHVSQTGEVKFCVLGLTMTTDSPKFLLLTVTCGLVSASLLSGVSRAFLWRLWKSACQWCSHLLPTATDAISLPVKSSATKMGQKMTVTTSVQLNTDTLEAELDLLTSYEIIDLPRIRVRTRDAQTSPIHQSRQDVAVATLSVEVEDRASSPFSLMYESVSSDDLILMFEGEEGEMLRDGSGVSLNGDNSELYEKLGSIQKALQEANQEMDSYMSTLSEISQRHFCSPAHSARGYPSAAPFSASSGDSNNVLMWEDEFGSLPLTASSTTTCPRNNPPETTSNCQDLTLWQSELHFYSGLSSFSYPQTDTQIETNRSAPYTTFQGTTTARDSGCSDLWDALENDRFCSTCGCSNQKPAVRPLSAPSSMSSSGCHLTVDVSGVNSCDSPLESSQCVSCRAIVTLSNHGSPDRVPKLRRLTKKS